MAIIRNTADSGSLTNYVGSIALYVCVSCLILMLKFKAFRARINISSSKYHSESNVPEVSITGAYRTKKEEFFGSGNLPDPPKKITPSMVKLPANKNSAPTVRSAKSTSDLTKPEYVPLTASRSNLEISFDPRGGPNSIPTAERQSRQPERPVKERKKEGKVEKKVDKERKKEDKERKKEEKNQKEEDKEQKRLAKKRLAEQKAQEKAAQEQAKQQAKRETEQAPQVKARIKKDKKSKTAPPIPVAQVPPVVPQASVAPIPPTRRQVVPTISIQSDIDRSSGPPPYTELPVQNEKDNTGNTSFSKPLANTSSWDMISQHRQQINRPTAAVGAAGRKQMVMDLQYKYANDNANDQDNSEA